MRDALRKKTPVDLEITAKEGNNGRIVVSYKAGIIPQDSVINFALAEPSRTERVQRGENGGRTLSHSNVVREFITQKAKGNGEAILTRPGSGPFVLVAYIQDGTTWQVLGASKVEI